MALKKTGVMLFAAAMAVAAAIIPSAASAAPSQAGSVKATELLKKSAGEPAVNYRGLSFLKSRHLTNHITLASTRLCGAEVEWCIWTGTNGTGAELSSINNVPNLDTYGFRNKDESLEAEAGGGVPYLVRFNYSTNYSGAWVCIDSGTYLANAANYTFNNGSGRAGYGQGIYKNIASVQVVFGQQCTNPTH